MTIPTILSEAVKKFEKERTDALSEMFDNIDTSGIYPTTKLFTRLDTIFLSSLHSLLRAEIETIQEMIDKNRDEILEMEGLSYLDGYLKGLVAVQERLKSYLK